MPAKATTERAAMVTLPLDLLAQLLQLPAGARIDSAQYDPADYASLRLRVVGAGWPVHPGGVILTATAWVHEYRDDDGRRFKRVVDWQIPGNVRANRRIAAPKLPE